MTDCLKAHVARFATNVLLIAWVCSAAAAVRGADSHRPADYSAFVDVADYPGVAEAVAEECFLYFSSTPKAGREYNEYVVDNPIVVDRDTPLVMHGNFAQVTLVPKDIRKPLFIIRDTPYFNLERVRIDYHAYPDFSVREAYTNAVAIRFENRRPLRADFQLVDLRQAGLEIRGPGRFVLQRYGNRMHGLLHAGTLIDHPDADVYLISAGGLNRPEPPILDSDDIYWLWCKRGHIEVYGAFPAGFTRGRADIRIDTPSPRGAHIIAYSRSEGTKRGRGSKYDGKGADRRHEAGGAGDARSQLLYVPPSDLPVDIALKANLLGGDEPETSMVEYHAAGTLWLLGNNALPSHYVVKTESDIDQRRTFLVQGDAPQATVMAFGNSLANTQVLARITARTKMARANLVRRHWWYLDKPERARMVANAFLPAVGDLDGELPPVPRSNPPILGCIPVGATPPPALGLVSVRAFGAVGDGKTDDTAALQAAFDSDKVLRLFFPPGTYRTSKPLELRIHERYGAGGWLVGAGPDRSVIRNTAGGRVVNANGLYWTLLQGLGFETVDQRDICFHLDKVTGHTSGVLFHNCRFKGGRVAMGIAMEQGPNCEHIMHTHCLFEDADIGFCMGNPNALKNIVAESAFRNNRINLALRWWKDGALAETGIHGCFGVIGATFSNTREKDFDFSLHKRRYFLGIVSDSPMICDSAVGSKFVDVQIYENCEWFQTDPVFYRTGTSGGPIFLYSRVKTGGLEILPGRHGIGFAVNLWSRLGGEPWDDPVRLYRHGQTD